MPGSPDIALTKYKIAIFCDGEFFHGYNWDKHKLKVQKGNNSEYWIKKIEQNIARDDKNDKELRYLGWTVIRFWGNDILKHTDDCINAIEETIFDIKMSSHYG